METGRKKRVRDGGRGGRRSWLGGEEAGVKSGTRLVPAFHSHWPCRSLYRYLSSFSFFFFSPLFASLLLLVSSRGERERKTGNPSLDRLPPRISFSFSSFVILLRPPAQRQLDRGTSRALRDEDIPRVRFAKLPDVSAATGRPRPRVNGPIAELFPFYREEFVLAANPHPPLDFFLRSLVFSLSLSLGTYFTLRRVMVHGLLWVPFFFFPSLFLLLLVSSVDSSVDTLSFVLRLRFCRFFSSHFLLVIRSHT